MGQQEQEESHDSSMIQQSPPVSDVVVVVQPPITKRDETLFLYIGDVVTDTTTATTSDDGGGVAEEKETSITSTEEPIVKDGDVDNNNGTTSSAMTTTTIRRQAEGSTETLMNPPMALKNPYGWLRDDERKNQEVVDYLQLENQYTKSIMDRMLSGTTTVTTENETMIDTLYQELVATVQETDYTAPYLMMAEINKVEDKNQESSYWWYYTRTFAGLPYKVYCRAPATKSDDDNEKEWWTLPPTIQWQPPPTTTDPSDQKKKKKDEENTIVFVHSDCILPNEEILLDVNQVAKMRPTSVKDNNNKQKTKQEDPDTKEDTDTKEEVDSSDSTYCVVGMVVMSPSHQYLAYTVDYTGNETYDLRVIPTPNNNIDTNTDTTLLQHQQIREKIGETIRWSTTDDILFYQTLDETHRPYRVYQMQVNKKEKEQVQQQDTDLLLFEELNDTYWIGMYKSSDSRFLFIESSSKETTEIYYLNLRSPTTILTPAVITTTTTTTTSLPCIAPRRPKVLYEVDHRDDSWWISSNIDLKNKKQTSVTTLTTPNMALFTCSAVPNSTELWEYVVTTTTTTSEDNDDIIVPCFDGSYERSLEGVQCFKNHVVACGREHGLPQLWILGNITNTTTKLDQQQHKIEKMERLTFPEEAYDCGLSTNRIYDTNRIAIMYSSLVTPSQTISILLNEPNHYEQRKIMKEKCIPGYDKSIYGCQRFTVPSSNDSNIHIPVSIVYKLSTMEKYDQDPDHNPLPVHLYGYGSYGSCIEADYNSNRLPLLNRGIVYVLVHVRGGGELGRQWYEEPNGAKYLCKKNTFYDFIDVAKYFVTPNTITGKPPFSSPSLLSCEGRSAGGLLIGASINMAPELFRVALLLVPFVDVVPTMSDATIPLTALEWEEWGNPNEHKYYQYMIEYSPTSNVVQAQSNNDKTVSYPACLFTCGYHDPRVPFWEAAKFVAELRYHTKYQSDINPICLQCDFGAGHFSASDRYKYLKEKAYEYTFLLGHLGILNHSTTATTTTNSN